MASVTKQVKKNLDAFIFNWLKKTEWFVFFVQSQTWVQEEYDWRFYHHPGIPENLDNQSIFMQHADAENTILFETDCYNSGLVTFTRYSKMVLGQGACTWAISFLKHNSKTFGLSKVIIA